MPGELTTPGTFEFLGVPPLLGRAAQPADYEPGAPPVFLMRYKVWVSRFNSDPSILNKTFTLNGVSRTLIGIMPPRFAWGDADMWIPEKPVRAQTNSSGFPRFWYLAGPAEAGSHRTRRLRPISRSLRNSMPRRLPPNIPSISPC